MSRDRLVADIVATVLDVDADGLRGALPLADIGGWDSVNAMRVLAYLESRLDAPLDYERFQRAETVGDLVAVVDLVGAAEGGRHG